MDDRYEVRDAQFFAGELADAGLIDGQKIGATGGSYGGGLSLALAALKDRVMMPDGSLVPWTSPIDALPMRIAAATPDIPWSDLAYSLDAERQHARLRRRRALQRPDRDREAESFQSGLYLSGQRGPLLRPGAVPLAVRELRRRRDGLEGPPGRRRALRRRPDR